MGSVRGAVHVLIAVSRPLPCRVYLGACALEFRPCIRIDGDAHAFCFHGRSCPRAQQAGVVTRSLRFVGASIRLCNPDPALRPPSLVLGGSVPWLPCKPEPRRGRRHLSVGLNVGKSARSARRPQVGLNRVSRLVDSVCVSDLLLVLGWHVSGTQNPGGIVHVALGTLKLEETVPHVPLDERTARESHTQRNECQRKPSSSMQASSALPLCHPAFSVPLERGLACEGGSS